MNRLPTLIQLAAGAIHGAIFATTAIERISYYAKGIPRLINVIAICAANCILKIRKMVTRR